MAYIDPGTGSMLFAIIVGIAGAVGYAIRSAWVKLRFVLSGGKKVEANAEIIPFAIYAESKRYWNIFEPVCREFDKRGIDVAYLTASKDDPAFECGLDHVKPEFIGEGNHAFARMNMLRADVVLCTTPGLDVYQWKRSKESRYYVHIMHAAGEVTLYRMFGLDYYDAVLLSGQFQANDLRGLERQRNLPAKDLAIVGIPYMDEMAARLAREDAAPAGKGAAPAGNDVLRTDAAACTEVAHATHERTVLLAPSWGSSAIFGRFGGSIIDALLKTGYHVIVRPHPQSFDSEKQLMDKLMKTYPDSAQLEWNRDRDNFDCLRRSDVLISDFSGVIYDFALVHGKPIIYTNPDFKLDPYDAWWQETPLWTYGALPRLGAELTEDKIANIKELIDDVIDNPRYEKTREEVLREVWAHPGHGAENIVDFLVAHAQPAPSNAKAGEES